MIDESDNVCCKSKLLCAEGVCGSGVGQMAERRVRGAGETVPKLHVGSHLGSGHVLEKC